MIDYDVIIIGAGPAGMAVAVSVYESGVKSILVLDRNAHLGGILKQCIHDGFGLVRFEESLTGPEYAARYSSMLHDMQIDVILNAMVTTLTPERDVHCVTRSGVQSYKAKAVILSTGCRERTRGMLELPGTRPSGIYTAGVAQKLINIQNIRIGDKVVILGSGDVGMIMARRMTLEGMDVICVLEKLPHLSGLIRNKNQCLDDYHIPLKLCQTVVDIHGSERLEFVTAASVDKEGDIITGSEYEIKCDTLVLSVGLIPENELAKACGIVIDDNGGPKVNDRFETSVEGIFSAGNSLHVHDLADYASEEGAKVGQYAANFVLCGVK